MTGAPRRLRRSKLFVPGVRGELFAKALAGPADAISFDLEDAVPADAKDRACQAVAAFLRARGAAAADGKEMIVRVNALSTGRMIEDLLAVAGPGLDTVNVPKVEGPREIIVADEVLRHAERAAGLAAGSIALMPTLESPAGLRRAHEIAVASPRVVALQLGTGDLKAATGMSVDTARLHAVRTLVVLAAAEAGVAALDSAFVNIADSAAFERDAAESRALGFAGKSCIHPSQVAACNRIFAPTAAELDDARALLAAYDAARARGVGAINHRGMLVDQVHALEARRLLQLAGDGGRAA
ncbi:MAG: CoA ester lyase [Burkholderiales bacterium]|nr:CoA ester lyase [Burkholderiales bacterium]